MYSFPPGRGTGQPWWRGGNQHSVGTGGVAGGREVGRDVRGSRRPLVYTWRGVATGGVAHQWLNPGFLNLF